MAKTYRVTPGIRLANRVFGMLIRPGAGKQYRHLLTVPGREIGRLHTTPVDVMRQSERRSLVAAYGVTMRVRNARAAGQVAISRRGRSVTLRVIEPSAEDSVPAQWQHMKEVPLTRTYVDATPDSPDREIAAQASRHPVFLLTPLEA